MAGMWIVHAEVADEELFGSYLARAREILTSHGATYIARGGRYEQMEGKDRSRNVVAVFPTFEDAVACYRSDAYQGIVGDAKAGSDRTVVIVETDD